MRPDVNTCIKKSKICTPLLASIELFSTWKSLLIAVYNLKKICRLKKGFTDSLLFDVMQEADHFILQEVQAFFYNEEFRSLNDGKRVTSSGSFATLNNL